ncbi:MAG: hypothetical protein ACOYN3_06030 [Acidimicrobiia bacterium]
MTIHDRDKSDCQIMMRMTRNIARYWRRAQDFRERPVFAGYSLAKRTQRSGK